MSSKGKIERWLLADWNGGRLLKSSSMIRVTEELNVGITEASHKIEAPKTDITSGGDNSSEGQRVLKAIENNGSAGPSEGHIEGRDYSPSASSWEPSDDENSSDSASVYSLESHKASFTKQYWNKSNSKKVPKPVHRPNAVIADIIKARQLNNSRSSNSRKRRYNNSIKPISVQKYSADSTRRNHTPPIELQKNGYNESQEIQDIKAGFQELFRMLNDLKPQPKRFLMEINPAMDQTANKTNNSINGCEEYDENSERSESEDSDRSDDNVLISNKFNRVAQDLTKKQNLKIDSDVEWVQIGSGKTMIHKEKFRKVNWKSYTIATRTLLLAAFPRRILATHSLTGKRSPAFKNKPAKMCLDPKIVTDIVLEITSRFNVKENLVRGIITTKCADECKMLKTRLQSKKKPLKNDQNGHPATTEKAQK